MMVQQRIDGFIALGNFLKESEQNNFRDWEKIFSTAYSYNQWFTRGNIEKALNEISFQLSENSMKKWLKPYELKESANKNVGVIMAGNIPVVGFHDFLCVLISGNSFIGKTSSQDKILLPFLADKLVEIEPGFKNKIHFTEGLLKQIDAVIATGSNNSANYFEYYFGKYPNIIRKNRNSVAVLGGKETNDELKKLGDDIFSYFGLGCRNVSKIYIPEGYDLDHIFKNLLDHAEVINNNKYANNYQYNRTIYLLNSIRFFENNFLILKEDQSISSPISVVFFEYYKDMKAINERLKKDENLLQCIASNLDITGVIPLGATQSPNVWDYADNVDTLSFLTRLN
jgi:hypothetical protein